MAATISECGLTPYLIRYGYSQGCFPMTLDDGSVEWFRPKNRALLPLSGIRTSRSLAKVIRQGKFEIRFDTSFEAVMRGCLRPNENWISEEFIQVYTQIYFEGWGHSVEAWRAGKLVGGAYGVALGSCFCAESMFHRERDASKVALHALVERCRDLNFTVFDAQIMNPHLDSLGAYVVPNQEYLERLEMALTLRTKWDQYREPFAK